MKKIIILTFIGQSDIQHKEEKYTDADQVSNKTVTDVALFVTDNSFYLPGNFELVVSADMMILN